MTQSIDPAKPRTSAENLEWAPKQYPDNEDGQNLLRALLPFIEAAKTRVSTGTCGATKHSWRLQLRRRRLHAV